MSAFSFPYGLSGLLAAVHRVLYSCSHWKNEASSMIYSLHDHSGYFFNSLTPVMKRDSYWEIAPIEV